MTEMPRPDCLQILKQIRSRPLPETITDWELSLIEAGAKAQRELLKNWVAPPTQDQLERDLDVLIVFENGGVDIPLSAERIINYLRGKE